MTSGPRVLLLDANGWGGWGMVASETVTRGLLGLRDLADVPAPFRGLGLVRRALRDRYAGLSYAIDWRDAFVGHPGLRADVCNILNLVDYRRACRRIGEYDLVVVLHSATGDNMALLRRTASWFDARRARLVVFVGNEYNLLADKLGFIRDAGAEFVASQLPLDSARWLYATCPGAEVVPMPHALNPAIYRRLGGLPRTTDIGFVGARYPFSIGDLERAAVLEHFERRAEAYGLAVDIRYGNMPRAQWVEFLNRCRAVVGAEAGTYYLDPAGELIPRVEAFVREHPDAGFEDVYARFFRDRPIEVSGKAISSRHFEPIGTGTCQLLLEGRYNGILEPDVHYIALRRDLSNAADAVRRYRDAEYRQTIIEAAFAHVMTGHTYAHRVQALLAATLGEPTRLAATA